MGIAAARLLAPLALVVAPAWEGRALAFTPAEIIAAAPESERSFRQAAEVASAERALRAAEAGTDASLRLEPALSYGADIEDPAALAGSFDLSVALGWRYDPVARRRARADLLYARERLRHWRRADVRDALRLLGATLRAEVALQRAQLDLERARDAAAAARARALVEARGHALASLRASAAELGFLDAPRLEAAAFALPPAPDAPPTRERLRLELEAARLDRDRAAAFEVLRSVTLDATYESKTDRFQLSTSLALDRGRPSAGLAGEVGNQEDDQWSLRLSADIRLGARAEDARAARDERVRRAEAELAAVEDGYPRRAREAMTAVGDARAALSAELAAWREEVAGLGANAGLRPGAAEDGAAESGANGAAKAGATPRGGLSSSACRALLARENAVYGAWLDLVSATYAYLETVDGTWQVAAGRSRAGLPRSRAAVAPADSVAPAPQGAMPAPPSAAASPATGADGPSAPWPVRTTLCAAPLTRPLSRGPRTPRSRPEGG